MTDRPWLNEPCYYLGNHVGLVFTMGRTPTGCWSGYVGVPGSHPFFGHPITAFEPELDVHGGLVFSSMATPFLSFSKHRKDVTWWFGFHCSHYSDLKPYVKGSRGNYRSFEYALHECYSLAEQLNELFPPMLQVRQLPAEKQKYRHLRLVK